MTYQGASAEQRANRDAWEASISTTALLDDYAIGAAQGTGRGIVNTVEGVGEMVVEVGNQARDAGNDILALTLGEEYAYKGHKSSLGQAANRRDFSYKKHVGESVANTLTLGVYGQGKTLVQLAKGEISIDQASKQLGSSAVMQLAGSRAFGGTRIGQMTPRQAVQAVRSLPANLAAARNMAGGSWVKGAGLLNKLSKSAFNQRQKIVGRSVAGDLAKLRTQADRTYAHLMDLAENTLDFSTSKHGAVFWSGKPRMQTAQAWAAKRGKTTLEQTAGGRVLDRLDLFGKNHASIFRGKLGQAADVWDVASRRFAEGASGRVNVFNTGTSKIGGHGGLRTWWRVEKKALKANPAVTDIIRRRVDGGIWGSPRS